MTRRFLVLLTTVLVVSITAFAASDQVDQHALNRSMAHFRANPSAFGLSDADQDLSVVRSRRDKFGVEHVRFQQKYKGLRVFEGEAVSHVKADGSVSVTSDLRFINTINTKPGITKAAAVAKAVQSIAPRGAYSVPATELLILPRGERSGFDRLAYRVQVFVENDIDDPQQWDYFIDAESGEVAFSFNSLETTNYLGTGKTMYVGNKSINEDLVSSTYYMRDVSRPASGYNATYDLKNKTTGTGTVFSNTTGIFGNNVKDSSDRSTAGADAHYGLMATWDFYKNTFGRNGIDGSGTKTYSRVHYGNKYENAFWSDTCFCMTYGDGATTFYPLVSLDVAGHEMSHGVMSREANLTYSGESGGLNEGNSDIFGTMVEFYVNDTNDVPDYWIGERVYKSNWSTGTYVQTKALRYMDNPPKDGASPACWSSTLKNLDVHYSSGPINHWFWLLSNPASNKSVCNSAVVTGIGRADAAAIWYRAISVYMTAGSNYAAARTAALQSAADLFGSSSTQYAATAAAFSAINVN